MSLVKTMGKAEDQVMAIKRVLLDRMSFVNQNVKNDLNKEFEFLSGLFDWIEKLDDTISEQIYKD